MLQSLKSIAARIDTLLAGDPFPEQIEPEFLAEAVRDYPSRGGKRLRPALAFWCSRLLKGRDDAVLYPAAALEVYHNWTLVHDDIIDQDSFRRNQPATHYRLAEYLQKNYRLNAAEAMRQGQNFAMLCGDIQQAWANDLLQRAVEFGVTPETVTGISRRVQHLGNRLLVSGEALDMELALRPVETIHPEEVIKMLRMKTGALLQLAAETGAMSALNTGNCNLPEVIKLGEFAMCCGVAFQLQDDWLGLFGNEEKLGKAIGGDLREAKPTVMLLTSLRKLTEPGQKKLLSFLHRDSYTISDIEEVRDMVTACGAADSVRQESVRYAGQALEILSSFQPGDDRNRLGEFVNYMINRDK